jgi:hypothetical protein
MTTQHKSFTNISGGYRNEVLPMYISLKIPKSRETVPLRYLREFGRPTASFCMRILNTHMLNSILQVR